MRGIYFIDPGSEEFKNILKNADRKLEIPMPAAMPCNLSKNGSGENCRGIWKHKTKYACIVEADESMRVRLEGVPYRYHEDHIAAKGINSLSQYNLVHKFIPMPRALKKIPGCKGCSGKRMGKFEQILGMAADGSQKNKSEVIAEARNEGRTVHFAS